MCVQTGMTSANFDNPSKRKYAAECYQIGLFKIAKIKGKKIGFGDFKKKPTSVASKSPTSSSLNFSKLPDVLLPKIAQNRQKTKGGGFWRYQMWISQKSPNLHFLLTVIFGVFEQFLAKPIL